MAQRDQNQSIQTPARHAAAATPAVRTPLTAEERERLDRAVAHIDDPKSREIARHILEDYRETFEYLKDR